MAINRSARRAVAAGAVGAATLSALLLSTTPASAAPVVIPGVGNFDVPDPVLNAIPKGVIPPNILPPGTQIPGLTAPAPAQAQSVGQRAANAALSRVGDPYVYGATGPNSFDCSGLVKWSYAQAGRDLPRTSYEQLNAGAPVALNSLQPGDVVSYYGGSHSGLYVGNGNIVHASTYGKPVAVAPLYSMPIAGARRY
ncbi:C40 family peptidase [Nocardia sp. NEAU-G5]|uniref:C40 family peptidase n=1 Tax=Nocardia albiluteola TaxID=2842303 RepID=A0ABS6B148_9NOCA|nr:C40 family peptidase [Nocardia albiluteola]MBU3064026.1 C40 family peptidase [Nocardia albiluteola]